MFNRDQAGTYKCQAKNVHGKAEAEVTVDVFYRPSCSVSQACYHHHNFYLCWLRCCLECMCLIISTKGALSIPPPRDFHPIQPNLERHPSKTVLLKSFQGTARRRNDSHVQRCCQSWGGQTNHSFSQSRVIARYVINLNRNLNITSIKFRTLCSTGQRMMWPSQDR